MASGWFWDQLLFCLDVNSPPREVCTDNKQVYECVWHGCLYLGVSNTVLRHTKEAAHSGNQASALSGAVIHSQTHCAKPSNANSLSHYNPAEAWGNCRWTHHVTFSCSSFFCLELQWQIPSQTTAYCKQIPFPIASADLQLCWQPSLQVDLLPTQQPSIIVTIN